MKVFRHAAANGETLDAIQQLFEHADRSQSGRGFQQRQDFAFPNAGERIGPPPFARRLFLAGQPGGLLAPVGG